MCYLRKRKLKSKGNSFLYLLLSRILDYLPLISQSEKKIKEREKIDVLKLSFLLPLVFIWMVAGGR
jgi:hypothetical protein